MIRLRSVFFSPCASSHSSYSLSSSHTSVVLVQIYTVDVGVDIVHVGACSSCRFPAWESRSCVVERVAVTTHQLPAMSSGDGWHFREGWNTEYSKKLAWRHSWCRLSASGGRQAKICSSFSFHFMVRTSTIVLLFLSP